MKRWSFCIIMYRASSLRGHTFDRTLNQHSLLLLTRSTFFVDFVPEALPGALSAESPKCEGYWPFQALAAAYLVYDCGVESDREVK